jgi:hypothetical protein
MGYSQSWLAVRGKPRPTVLDELGLRATGTREQIAESPIVGTELPTGWYLVVTDRSGHRLTRDSMLQKLSAGCEIVTGDVEEHVMVSVATGWMDGQKLWSVVHDGQRDMQHLDAQGDMPVAFANIRDGLRSEQQEAGGSKSDVDYIFDVPVELARTLTGYRHDTRISGADDRHFEILIETSSTSSASGHRASFFKRLLGG